MEDQTLDRVVGAWSDFLGQPFGAFGAVCIMLAVTAINSQRLAARLGSRDSIGPTLFNGLNLVGGVCLLVNAFIRHEVVWVVLEIYFVVIALKGLAQLQRTKDRTRNDAKPDEVLSTTISAGHDC